LKLDPGKIADRLLQFITAKKGVPYAKNKDPVYVQNHLFACLVVFNSESGKRASPSDLILMADYHVGVMEHENSNPG